MICHNCGKEWTLSTGSMSKTICDVCYMLKKPVTTIHLANFNSDKDGNMYFMFPTEQATPYTITATNDFKKGGVR